MGKDVRSIASVLGAHVSAPSPIAPTHEIGRFTCGNEALDDYLRLRALKAEGKTGRTYVVCAASAVVGFYTLAMGAVQRPVAPKRMQRNAPDHIPVAILGRMAVDVRFRGQGIGAGLLKDGLRRIVHASSIVGARAVLVHAIDNEARTFYAKYGFIEFPADSRTMFLPLESIVDAL